MIREPDLFSGEIFLRPQILWFGKGQNSVGPGGFSEVAFLDCFFLLKIHLPLFKISTNGFFLREKK